ncbi:hypothetical protein EDD22DRAFT_849784 [Suillus occidentalis]|nr:hypothetical protein EDD22DRAFT_849784 [Suillus occidentalis]
MGRKLVHTFMEKEFPLFRLDADGWKLSLLCTTDYPNWRKTHIDNESNWKNSNKKVQLKREVIGGDDLNLEAKLLINISKGKKHACDDDDANATRKHAKESSASSSSFTGLIESLSHSSASAAGSLDMTASLSSLTVLIDSELAKKENIPIFLKNPLADVFGGVNGILKRIPSPALCDPDAQDAKSILKKKSRTSNVDRVDATQSARINLCAIRWQKNINKKGTTDQFRMYWGALSMAQQDEYQAKAKRLNNAGSWTKPSDSAVVNGILY